MNLIAQGNNVQSRDLEHLAMLSGANAIETISEQAFRLRGGARTDGVADYCAQAELDYAFVPENRRLTDFGLVVMDMDSTVITIECIDEIADIGGIRPQMEAFTSATMRGEIDFGESLRRRVALLAGLDASALARVYDDRLQLSPGVEKMLQEMKTAGLKTLVVTGGFTYFTERLKPRLGIDYVASNTVEIVNGQLTGRITGTIFSAQAKADELNRIRQGLGLENSQVIAIGDGANDLNMMVEAGVSVAFRAKPIIRQHANYALNYMALDGVLNLFG